MVELQHIAHECIEVHRHQLGSRQARIVAKFVDQPLHGVHLVNDGFYRLGEQRLLGRADLAVELHFKALGRQLDGRERILDFMRKPARHLAPGLRALSRHHVGNIVEHQQILFGTRHFRAPRNERDGVVAGAVPGGMEFKRLLPVRQRVRCVVAEVFGELRQHILGKNL